MKTRFLQGLLLCVALVGFAQAEITPRIVGGEESSETYPWMVSIQYKDSGQHFCGGTLIGSRWVVTAAHCTEDASAEQLQVVIGIQNLNEPDTGETFDVRSITNHAEYDFPDKFDNDISLLRISGDSSFSPIDLISTAEFNQINTGDLLTTMGWGALAEYDSETEEGEFPAALNEVQVPLVSPSTCRNTYGDVFTAADNPLCAGYLVGGKDSCQGDSGGPLIIDVDGDPKLVGVVSWGEGCARILRYGVYTNVSEYINWLEQNMVTPAVDFELDQDFFIIGNGETTTLPLTFFNYGDDTFTIRDFDLSSFSQYVSLVDNDCLNTQLQYGDSCEITATAIINTTGWLVENVDVVAGSTFNFAITITAIDKLDIPFMNQIELDWYTAGSADWTLTEGTCQLRSGAIGDNQFSMLLAHFSGTQGPIFNIDVSSELNADALLIYLDDKFMNLVISGEGSGQLSFDDVELEDKDHRILFYYTKNGSLSVGSDMASITSTEFKGQQVSDDCSVDGEPRVDLDPTPATPESSVTGSSGGGAAFYLLLPLLLLNFRNSKASHK